jgi:hypothetical protein
MIDTCTQALAVILLMALSGCGHIGRPGYDPPPLKAPFAACANKPAPLPAIATVEQVRARHDRLDALYVDCAARLRANLDAAK